MMMESITTLTQAQQVAAIRQIHAEHDQLAVHELPENSHDHSQDHDSHRQPDFRNVELQLQNALAEKNQSVRLALDKDTKRMIVRVINDETKEVVKQYPSDEMLKISRMIIAQEKSQGNITDERV
jgi:flagellar protein FlaG